MAIPKSLRSKKKKRKKKLEVDQMNSTQSYAHRIRMKSSANQLRSSLDKVRVTSVGSFNVSKLHKTYGKSLVDGDISGNPFTASTKTTSAAVWSDSGGRKMFINKVDPNHNIIPKSGIDNADNLLSLMNTIALGQDLNKTDGENVTGFPDQITFDLKNNPGLDENNSAQLIEVLLAKTNVLNNSTFKVSSVINDKKKGTLSFTFLDQPSPKESSSKYERLDDAADLADVLSDANTMVEIGAKLTNYGDAVDAGGTMETRSALQHFQSGQGTDYATANQSWGDARTGTVGAGLTLFSGLNALRNARREGWQAAKDLKNAKTSEEVRDAGLGLVDSSATAFSAGLNMVNSVNNVRGAFNSAVWNDAIGAFGAKAIPITGIVNGGIQLVKNGFQIKDAISRFEKLKKIADRDDLPDDVKAIAKYAAETNEKRYTRALKVNLPSNALSTAGSATNATGVGIGVGTALSMTGAGVKYGAMAFRHYKQYRRDNHESKRPESYSTWLNRQNKKLENTINPIKKAKYQSIISKTPNWDKTKSKKQEKRQEMSSKLLSMGDTDTRNEILRNLGFKEHQITATDESKKIKLVDIEKKFAERE